MIMERESIMSEKEYRNREWFPNFIILCKPKFDGNNIESGNTENEWNGLLKELEKVIKRQIDASN